MKYQKKMIMVFSLLIMIASVTFGAIYFITIQKNYIGIESQNLKTAAENYGQQFGYSVQQMEEIIQQIISNSEVLESIQILSRAKDIKTDKSRHYTDATNSIRSYLNTDYFKKNFNRVVHFMQNGSVISGTNFKYNPADPGMDIHGIEWLNLLEGKKGKFVILGMHEDDWSQKERIQVISVVKQLVGENLGYLEVQKSAEDLDKLFVPANSQWNLYVFQDDQLIYSSNKTGYQDDEAVLSHFFDDMEKAGENGKLYEIDNKLMAVSSLYTDEIRAVIVDHTMIYSEAMKSALPLVLILIFMTGAGSFAYIYIMSRRMVKPIRQLKDRMENTDIHTLEITEHVEIEDKEIRKLYESYEQVLEKLSQSIQKERLMSDMQKQAQFDLLQAQVNPHFLFNVLNVISSRGAEADDEVICDICADLGQMLRYSTDVQTKQARLEEEVHYLKLYLELLKFRYEDMMEYEVNIDPALNDLEIPKMVLQQIVENSISHGYTDVDRVRKLAVIGEYSSEYWVLKVRDNGIGMEEEIKDGIYEKCREIREALTCKRSHVEMAIGGMGLVNTYARLYQIYGESFFMEIKSLDEGTEVSIGVTRQGGK